MGVNWDLWSPTQIGPLKLWLPTYGLYGMEGYTGGEVGGNDVSLPGIDELDELFKQHDIDYSKGTDYYADADRALVDGIANLKQTAAWDSYSPEAQAYGNFAQAYFGGDGDALAVGLLLAGMQYPIEAGGALFLGGALLLANPLLLRDPLVIDLNGDGLDLIDVQDSTAHFDYGDTGFAPLTGWFGPTEAVLIRDLDGNPDTVTGSEMLGAASGNAFADLEGLDHNQDDKIDSSDAVFSQLKVWRDFDSDGVGDAGEVVSLSDASIVAVNLNPQPDGQTIAGNHVIETSTVVFADGTSRTMAEVHFATDALHTRFIPPPGFQYSEGALSLPKLVGYGTVPDLASAMSLQPSLEQAVRSLVLNASTMSGSEFEAAFEDLVQKWTQTDGIDPASRGPLIDARHMAVVEAFYGVTFEQLNGGDASLNAFTASNIEATYQALIDALEVRLVSQIPLAQLANGVAPADMQSSPLLPFSMIAFDPTTDSVSVDFNELIAEIVAAAPADAADQFGYYDLAGRLIKSLRVDLFDEDTSALATAFQSAATTAGLDAGHQGLILAVITSTNVLETTTGATSLTGTDEADAFMIANGGGTITGDAGDDWYVYADTAGGATTIVDNDSVSTDTLVFVDADAAEATLSRGGASNDVMITFADGDSVTVAGQFSDIEFGTIESIKFADGTVWTLADLRLMLLANAKTAGDDVIYGFHTGDVVDGGAGDDTLIGRQGNDTLIGGAGNDTLSGDGQDDSYVFNLGDGQDVIKEWSATGGAGWGGNDTIQFGPGITAADLVVSQANNGEDLVIAIAGTTDQITIDRGISSSVDHRIEQVRFVLTHAQLMALTIAPTSGNDIFYGDETANTLSGGAGDDSLIGRQGNDTLLGGAGNDTLSGDGQDDSYVFNLGDGQDVVKEWSATGGAGWGGNDTIKFGPGITAADLVVSQANNGEDLVIAIAGTSDQITIVGGISGGFDYRIEQVRFDDGSVLTHAQLMALAIPPTSGNDVFYGDETANTLTGGAGDDTLIGRQGNDTLIGGAGNDALAGDGGADSYVYTLGDGADTIDDNSTSSSDTLVLHDIDPDDVVVLRNGNNAILIVGPTEAGRITIINQFDSFGQIENIVFDDSTTWSAADVLASVTTSSDYATHLGTENSETINASSDNDVIDGLAGDDTLHGGFGNDTYVFRAGSGSDAVIENGDGSETDRIRLDGLNPADVLFGRNANHLLITIIATGETLRVEEHFHSRAYGLEQVAFADGTIWTRPTIAANAPFRGADGPDTIDGTSGNDTIVGGLGDDTVSGSFGSDTYIYASGDGNDLIDEESGSITEIDTLKFTDLNASDITLVKSGADVIVQDVGTGHQIILDEQYWSATANWGIDRFEFADGSSWTRDQIMQNAWWNGTSGNDTLSGWESYDNINGAAGSDTINGNGGDDNIIGGGGSDTLNGGAGNDIISGVAGSDILTGGSGNDIFVFNAAYGDDIITDFVAGAATDDLIEFTNGVFADFAAVQAASAQLGNDVVITIDVDSTITLQNVALANLHQDDFRFV